MWLPLFVWDECFHGLLMLWHPPVYCVFSRLNAPLLWEGPPFCMFIYQIMDVDQLCFGGILKRAEDFISTNSTRGLSSPWLACLGSHSNFMPRLSRLLQGEMRTERKCPNHWSAHQPLTVPKSLTSLPQGSLVLVMSIQRNWWHVANQLCRVLAIVFNRVSKRTLIFNIYIIYNIYYLYIYIKGKEIREKGHLKYYL